MLARPMLLQVLQPFDGLLYRGPMSGRHPPHDEITLVHPLEPLVAATIEAFVQCLPNEPLERLAAVPDRQVDGYARIAAERAGVDGTSAVILIAPHEPRATFRQAVHDGEVLDEVRHTRVVNLVAQAADIELSKVRRGHRDLRYSAATRTGSGCGFAL